MIDAGVKEGRGERGRGGLRCGVEVFVIVGKGLYLGVKCQWVRFIDARVTGRRAGKVVVESNAIG